LRYVAITPQTASIAVATTQQFTAQAFYSDGTTKDATMLATWASSNTNVATITPAGLATAGTTAGTSTISATYLGASATAALTVTQPYTAIVVSCTPATVAVGLTSNCTATGNPGAVDITTSVTWSSSTPTVATIPMSASASPIVATSILQGTTNISATLGTLTSNNFKLTVQVGPVSLKVSPSTPSLPIGGSAQFTALELWSDGTTHTPSGTVTFASSATGVLNVLGSGASAAVSAGSATVTATEGSLTGNTTVTVTAGVTKFAYISNNGDSAVQWYTVTAANAAPLASQGTVSVATPPVQTIIHPSGNFMYVIDNSSNVHVYSINTSTGQPSDTLLPITPAGQADANFGAIDPYGRYLYVVDSGSTLAPLPPNPLGTLFAFSINPTTGALTQIGSSPITAGLNAPLWVGVDRTGSYVYVTNSGANTLNAYQIGATGALTPLATANYPTGSAPTYATIDPSGNHVYVANNGDGTVTGYTVTKSTGALTPMTPATITGTANHVLNLVVDPSNKYLYVLDAGDPTTKPVTNGQVFGYVLNSDGSIPSAAITQTPIAAGPVPTGIATDISGTLLAVDNGGIGGPGGAGSISLYTITPSSGALTAKAPATEAAGQTALLVTFYNAAQ
jgi:6-phosphogluconolactonase (cycloisomerase 2 family)